MANVLLIVYTYLMFSIIFHLSYGKYLFREEPQDTVVNAHETAKLICVLSSRPRSAFPPLVYWLKSEKSTTTGSPVTNRRRAFNSADQDKYLVSGTGYHYNLEIVNTNFEDSAYYYCGVNVPESLSGNLLYSRRARLDVYDPNILPKCSFQPINRSLDVGDNVTIECVPSPAATTTQFLWKGHVRVHIIRGINGSLTHHFQLLEEDRNRPYTCTPSDTYPDVNNCTVVPLPHPAINLKPRTAATELGGTVGFSCETSGSPTLNQFVWVVNLDRENVQRLTESDGRFIVSTNGASGRLTITDVMISDNNTAVTCEVTNFRGSRIISDPGSVFIRPGSRKETSSNHVNTADTPTAPSWSTVAVEAYLDVTTIVQGSGTTLIVVISSSAGVTLILVVILLLWRKNHKMKLQKRYVPSLKPELNQPNTCNTTAGYEEPSTSQPPVESHSFQIDNDCYAGFSSRLKDIATNDVELDSLDQGVAKY